ncbi:MAG TPA: VCBS repeat-containing protein [Anaeromyxobacteraceae bacterium]|nr:VCBS repeat-containing protein [Anaeromyxobacteraceae bacterium]
MNLDPRTRRLSRLAAVLALLAAAGCSSGSSGPATLARSIAIADLDGGGRLDVLTALSSSNPASSFLSARIQLPAAPGTFDAPVRSPTGLVPVAMAVGDLDGDGLPDVVVADAGAGPAGYGVDVQYRVPATPGAFTAPVVLPLGALIPVDVALADLDGDGRRDVVVAASGASSVQVFFQQPSGAFGPATAFAAGGEPTAVAAGDLTGSGRQDLVVAAANGRVAVLLHGATPGSFLPPVTYAAGTSPSAVRLADMDGDGRLDVVLADLQGVLLVLLQSPSGGGVLLPAATYATLGYGSCSIAIGDVDGDGRPDVVVANAGPLGDPGSVSVFLQGAVPGRLGIPMLYAGYWGPLWVALGDLDGDGRLDMAVADGGPSIRFQSPALPGFFLPPVWLYE